MPRLGHRLRIWIGRVVRGSTPAAQAKPTETAISDSATSADSIWALVGNVVPEHESGEARERLKGSRHFSAGTKVYCLPAQWGDGYETCVAVGNARRPRRWITVVMRTELIVKWRVQAAYHPEVRKRLRAGFRGFVRKWSSREEVEQFAQLMNARSD